MSAAVVSHGGEKPLTLPRPVLSSLTTATRVSATAPSLQTLPVAPVVATVNGPEDRAGELPLYGAIWPLDDGPIMLIQMVARPTPAAAAMAAPSLPELNDVAPFQPCETELLEAAAAVGRLGGLVVGLVIHDDRDRAFGWLTPADILELAALAEARASVDPVTCTHRWVCGAPIAGVTNATCKLCGSERDFVEEGVGYNRSLSLVSAQRQIEPKAPRQRQYVRRICQTCGDEREIQLRGDEVSTSEVIYRNCKRCAGRELAAARKEGTPS